MNNQMVSLAVSDVLGRLGIAHDIMELETTEKTRPWQEGIVRFALRQGRNLTKEERTILEDFLQGGKKMNKTYWGWQWVYGLGCQTELCDGELAPCGKLKSFPSKARRDAWVEAGRWREKKTRGEALKLLRRGWTGNDAFDWALPWPSERERPLTDKELIELWRSVC